MGAPDSAAPDTRPVIDLEAIEALRELQDDDAPDFLAQVLRAFLEETPRAVVRIVESAERADAKAMTVEAHGLKGASRNVGAAGLAALCEEIERRARSGDLQGTAALAQELSREAERARAGLKGILAGAPER